jgi:hypothetical protein
MTKSTYRTRRRLKMIAAAAAALAAGVGLIVLSRHLGPTASTDTPTDTPTATRPDTQPAVPTPGDDPAPVPQKSATDDLSGMMLMFGVAAVLVSVLCIGWIVVDIRNSRPAWKTQTKYPKRR